MTHVGVTLGFSLPLNLAPAQAIEGCFHAAECIASDLNGRVLDDGNRELNERVKQDLRQNLRDGLAMFARSGMTTGSAEAIGLFG